MSGLNKLNIIPFLSYLPKHFTQIQRAQYGDVICGGRKSKKTYGTHFCYEVDCLLPTSFPILEHFTRISLAQSRDDPGAHSHGY